MAGRTHCRAHPEGRCAMSDELDFIPIEADDFEGIKDAIISAEDSAEAAIATLERLRDDLADAFGIPSFEWHKAPHEVRAAIEAIGEALTPIRDETDYAFRKLLKAERMAERDEVES